MNLGTGAVSWFEINGYGCNPVFNSSNIDPVLLIIKPDRVDDCLLDYEIIEIIQAGVQCFLAVSIIESTHDTYVKYLCTYILVT